MKNVWKTIGKNYCSAFSDYAIPERLANVMMEESAKDTIADDVAEEVEKVIKDVLGDDN